MDPLDTAFNVYKPSGPTSHDVVARLRRASGVRRIGHAGTLDPLAEGVLIVAVGQATRLIEYLAGLDKEYEADVTFGVQTATYDAEGTVVAERPADHLTREVVEGALRLFRGVIEQRPPAYSAVSVGGRRLYELARRGEAVEAPPRQVEVTRLELVDWQPPVARLLVECSKGTYIRSLAHDLGQTLGSGGFLSRLVRTRVGAFAAGAAVRLADLEGALRAGTWAQHAIAPDLAVGHLPAIEVLTEEARRILNGVAIPAVVDPGARGGMPPVARAYAAGRFLAIVRSERVGGYPHWRPEKVFAAPALPTSTPVASGKAHSPQSQ